PGFPPVTSPALMNETFIDMIGFIFQKLGIASNCFLKSGECFLEVYALIHGKLGLSCQRPAHGRGDGILPVGMSRSAVHANTDFPQAAASAAMQAAEPRFHTRIMAVASRLWNRDSANDVNAATANPPVMLTSVARSSAA